MRGHELTAALSRDFGVSGTASQPVFVIDKNNGTIYTVVGVIRERHDDATMLCTHWIEVEEV